MFPRITLNWQDGPCQHLLQIVNPSAHENPKISPKIGNGDGSKPCAMRTVLRCRIEVFNSRALALLSKGTPPTRRNRVRLSHRSSSVYGALKTFDPETETNRIAVAADLPRFPNRPILPMFFSCPLCGSWFKPSPLFNHEVHQRHETKPRNPEPIRGPRPGGPSDGSPARQRWVPSPHENQPQRGDRFPAASPTGQPLPARSDSSRPLRSRRQDRQGMASGLRPFPLRVFA